MNKTTTLKYLAFECEDPEEVEIAARFLVARLNELQDNKDKQFYLRTLKTKQHPIKKLYLDK